MFENRQEAGETLSQKLLKFKGMIAQACVKDALVLAIPRGGVVVGAEISRFLGLPLRALVVKKVPTLGQPELAAGAIGPEGIFSGEKDRQTGEIVKERIEKFGQLKDLGGKNVILVDDGIATGATIETAIKYLKKKRVGKITLAVPVAPKETAEKLKRRVDKLIILETPIYFGSVGEFYRDFPQVSDEEVLQLLQND